VKPRSSGLGECGQRGCKFMEVGDEFGIGFPAALLVRHAQYRRRVPGGKPARVAEVAPLATLGTDAEGIAKQGLGRHVTKTDHQAWLHPGQFCRQPLPARRLLGSIRALVQARRAAQLVLEVLDGIGEIDRSAVEPRLGHGPLEEVARGADEGLASQVFLGARLLAYQHGRRVGRTFAEYGARGMAPERAIPTCRRLPAHACQAAWGYLRDGLCQRNHGGTAGFGGTRALGPAEGCPERRRRPREMKSGSVGGYTLPCLHPAPMGKRVTASGEIDMPVFLPRALGRWQPFVSTETRCPHRRKRQVHGSSMACLAPRYANGTYRT